MSEIELSATDKILSIEADIDSLKSTISSGRLGAATYADLVAIYGDGSGGTIDVGPGTLAEVPNTDTGTHDDPVVGGTVSNAGVFRWSDSPAGWERLYENSFAPALEAKVYLAAITVPTFAAREDIPVEDRVDGLLRYVLNATETAPGSGMFEPPGRMFEWKSSGAQWVGWINPTETENELSAIRQQLLKRHPVVTTLAERNAIASPPYGLWVYVVEGARWYVWTENGLPVDPEEPEGARMDGWVGQRTDAELQATLDGAFDAINLNLGNINTELVKRQATLDTFAQLGAITGEYLYYGRHVYVTEGGRWFVWTQDGVEGADGWVGLRTEAELNGYLSGSFGGIDTALIAANASIQNNEAESIARDAAVVAQSATQDIGLASIYPAEIAALTAPPIELGVTVSTLALSWSILIEDGAPLRQKLSWSGNVVYLDGTPRALTVPDNWAAQANVMVIGDSLSSPGYSDMLAGATGLSVTRVALGGQTSRKQALRVGAMPVRLTLAGNSLPASGALGTVTQVNGGATDLTNPDAFLHTAAGDGSWEHSISGTLAGVAVTITHHPASVADVYEISQTGGVAVTVPPNSLFVPNWAARMATDELWICVGRNDISYPAIADLSALMANIDAMVRMGRGQRIMLFGVINAPNEGAGSSNLAMIKTLNDWMRATYPTLYAVDSQGRDLRQRLLASGGTTGDDASDRANEVIPRSLRVATDDLHLNATGYGIWSTFAQEVRAAQASPTAPIADGTVFTLNANGRLRQMTFSRLPRRFWGVSASAALTGAQVIALAGSELSAGRAKAFSVTAADQYVYYAYLASLGDPAGYAINGFSETFEKSVVNVITAAGHNANYIVIRSSLKLTGAAAVEVI